jgi:hypothetical protein
MRWKTMIAAVALCAAHAAPAKDQTGSAAAPTQPPKLPPEGARWVNTFVGHFHSSDVVFTQGDKTMKGSMDLRCTHAAAGWAATCTGLMSFGKGAKNSLALLYGWDVAAGSAHMFEVNSNGEVHDHAGKWTDDKTITVVHQGKTADGKAEEDGLTFAWQGKKVLVTGKGSADGAQTWSFSGTFSKL